MSKICLLAGISGVGKSSVATRVLEILDDLKGQNDLQRSLDAVLGKGRFDMEQAEKLVRMNIKRANFGEILFEISKDKNIAETKEDLRNLPANEIVRLQKLAVAQISKITGNVLIDLHLTVMTPQGMVAGLPVSSAKSLSPEVLILLEAPAQEVFRRRVKDRKGGVASEKVTLDTLKDHMAFDRAAAICIAAVSGVKIKTVKNIDVDEAATEVIRSFL